MLTQNEEQLVFKVTLRSSVLKSGKVPMYEILIDDRIVQTGTAVPDTDSMFVTELIASIPNGNHRLGIRLTNKNSRYDTKVDETGKIVDDLYLMVEKIEIDGIDLGDRILENSLYTLDQTTEFNGAQINQLSSHNCLTWNGTWTVTFSSPFYLWLLENL